MDRKTTFITRRYLERYKNTNGEVHKMTILKMHIYAVFQALLRKEIYDFELEGEKINTKEKLAEYDSFFYKMLMHKMTYDDPIAAKKSREEGYYYYIKLLKFAIKQGVTELKFKDQFLNNDLKNEIKETKNLLKQDYNIII